MKHLQLLTLLFFFWGNKTSFAQNYVAYYRLCNDAELQIREGNLIIAQGLLGHAFTLVPHPKAVDCFNLAKCYSQANQPDSTLKYLELSLTNSESLHYAIRVHHLWFEPILGAEKWHEIFERTLKSTTRQLTLQEEKIFSVYIKIDSLASAYSNYLYDSEKSLKITDSVQIKLYEDTLRQNIFFSTELFDNLCKAIGHIPDSHPIFEYRTNFSVRNFPLEWFDKNEEFLFRELQYGRFSPNDFVSYLLAKEYKQNGFLPNSYYTNEFSYEKLVLIEKYGVTFDIKINNFRDFGLWSD